MEQERNDGGNRKEACTTLGGLICVECLFSDRRATHETKVTWRSDITGCEVTRSITRCEATRDITQCEVTRDITQCEATRNITRCEAA